MISHVIYIAILICICLLRSFRPLFYLVFVDKVELFSFGQVTPVFFACLPQSFYIISSWSIHRFDQVFYSPQMSYISDGSSVAQSYDLIR